MGNVSGFHLILRDIPLMIIFLQGAKAQQKRERNADKNAAAGSKSQAKVNEAAKSIICSTCKQSFVSAWSSSAAFVIHTKINS